MVSLVRVGLCRNGSYHQAILTDSDAGSRGQLRCEAAREVWKASVYSG